jgi:hypothetical protein
MYNHSLTLPQNQNLSGGQMMRQDKVFRWLAGAVVCSLLLAAGCAPLGEKTAKPGPGLQIPKAATPETVTLALKFTPRDSTIYKVTTQKEKSVKLESSQPIPGFKGGHNLNRVEIIFTQQIQSTDDQGNAIAKITIEGLKYLAKTKDNLVLDFDSSREQNQNNPLAGLIGQSYTIEISPAGEVIEIIDVSQAQAAVRGGSLAHKTASELLELDAIKQRHEIMALPAADKKQSRTGDNWSRIMNFTFGMMGSKSYEKIYTLKEIKDTDNHRIAVLEMGAIPTAETMELLDKNQATNSFREMFDNIETYTGQLKLDLTAGKIEKYTEELETEWIIVDPEAKQEDKEPAALRMTAVRFYSLEKLD